MKYYNQLLKNSSHHYSSYFILIINNYSYIFINIYYIYYLSNFRKFERGELITVSLTWLGTRTFFFYFGDASRRERRIRFVHACEFVACERECLK